MKILSRSLEYMDECRFCVRAGLTISDKVTLVRETLRFHLDKRDGQKPRLIDAAVRVGPLTPRLRMRDSGGDVFIFHEVLKHRVYDVSLEWAHHEPTVIVDLGANIGLASLSLAAQFPSARIGAVEPHPETASLLRHNLACLGGRAHIWENAISDRTGTMTLNLSNEAYNASLVRASSRGVQVQSVTMSDILSKEGIGRVDILKVDIEGAERMLFAGSPAWLEQVQLLRIELHDGYGFSELRRDLGLSGLTVYEAGTAQAVARRERS